jgi:hypothetical protein
MPGLRQQTIKLVIDSYISKWIASIKDETVRDLVKRDTIVTGGCIASMLLGEQVNDYDVYFKTRETTLAFANYICNKFNKTVRTVSAVKPYKPFVQETQIENIKGELEDRIVFYMKSAGFAEENNETPYTYFEGSTELATDQFMNSDVVFDNALDVAEEVNEELKSSVKKERFRPVFLSENAATLSDRIQVITRFWGNPEEIHKTFDFVHAMCWYDYGTKNLHVPREAMESLLAKNLVYKGSMYPVASIFRTRKFIERGWKISAGQMLKILVQLNGVDLTNPKVLREQLLGVDVAYMHQLIHALSSEKGKVDATYIAKLVDKIFED